MNSTKYAFLNLRTFIYFALIVCILSIPFLYFIHSERTLEIDKQREALKVEYETQLKLFSSRLNKRFEHVALMSRLIADSRFMMNVLKNKADSKKTLVDAWSRVMRLQGEFRQIRYLGEDGVEVARVEYSSETGVRVITDLQDKSGRDYFKYAKTMKDEYAFFGADLEMEYGKYVKPYKVAMRIIVPVYLEGVRNGFLVVNLSVDTIFKNQLGALRLTDRPVIVGKDGYYIHGVEPYRLFGQRLKERSGHTLKKDRPELWKRMSNNEASFYASDNTYTVFEKFTLPLPGLGVADLGVYHDFDEGMVHSLVTQELDEIEKFQNVGMAMIVLLSLPLALFASHRRERQGNNRLAYAALKSMSPILVTDKDGIIQQANEAYCRMVKYTSDDLLGSQAFIFCLENYGYPDLADEIKLELDQHGRWEGEVTRKSNDGKTYIDKVEIVGMQGERSGQSGKHYVVSFNDITEEKRLNAELEMLTVTDALTGCRNRRYYDESIRRQILTFRRYPEQRFCLALLDIDHFKRVNDDYGHDVGDDVLKQFALVLKDSVRSVDLVCRVGGEEFAIILPNTDEQSAHVLLERIRAAVQTADIHPRVTCSIGYTGGVDGADEEALYQLADRALYNAKNKGRNRVVCAQ